MEGLQVPLNSGEGEPCLFPEGGDETEQAHPQALLANNLPTQLYLGRPALAAEGALPPPVLALHHPHWCQRHL